MYLFVGTVGAETELGSSDTDILDGGAGDDWLEGGDARDLIIGGADTDWMFGGGGADIFLLTPATSQFTASDQIFDWSTGEDLLSFGGPAATASNYGEFISATLVTAVNLAQAEFSNGLHYVAVEIWDSHYVALFAKAGSGMSVVVLNSRRLNAISASDIMGGIDGFASSANQVLTGGALPDYLRGGSGNDQLTGLGGVDVLLGGDGNDSLDGGAGDETLMGGAGDDTLAGGVGDVHSALVGGAGIDTATYAEAASGVNVSLRTTGPQPYGGAGFNQGLAQIENLTGSLFGDTLRGDSGVNVLYGNNGDDEMQVWQGDLAAGDVIDGGTGVGDPNDTLATVNDVDFTGGVTIGGIDRLKLGYDPNGAPPASVTVTFTADQSLWGLNYDLAVEGSSAADTVVIQGASGRALLGWTFSNWSGGDHVLMTGTSGGDSNVGTTSADWLTGEAGSDNLVGYTGDDTLSGGLGNDTLDGGLGNDVAVFEVDHRDVLVQGVFDYANNQFHTLVQAGGLGTDKVLRVETLSFSNGAFAHVGIQQNHLAGMDGARFDDVLIRNAVTGRIGFVDMIGQAAGEQGVVRAVTSALPAGWTAVGSGDLDGDGRAEAIVQGPTGGLFFVNTASGSAVWGTISANLPSEWKVVGLGDMTLDGTLDLVIRSSVSGSIMYAEMNGTTFGGWGNVFNMGTGWRAAGIGDYDRDGDSDVLVQEIATGTAYYVQMQSGGFAGWGLVTGGPGSQWVAKEAADLNGDGYFDVVFQNSGTGQIWYVNMAGGVNSGWGTLTTAVSWDVVGAGDYDNDGYADILVQSPSSGDLYYINVDNGVMAGWGNVRNGIGTDWIAV